MPNLTTAPLPPPRTRLAMAVLLALTPAVPAAAAEPVPAQLAAVEQINILGQNRQTIRETPLLRGPVIDMPQLVSTISSETLLNRQVTSLEDALRNVAGITTQVGEGGVLNGDQFTIRGQSAKNDIFTDGLRDFGAFTRDSFNYENISVLKGPSSTALGRGVSGGAINSGSKLPTTENFQTLQGGIGTANYHRAQYDANVALGDTTGLRVNLMAHENDAPDRDVINSERWGLAAALGFGIGTGTSVNLVYFHQGEDRVPDYGVPIAVTTAAADIEQPVTGFGVPQSSFYGYGADTDDVKVDTLTLLANHQFTDTLSLSSASKIGRYSRYFRQTVASCPAATCGNFLLDNNAATVPLVAIGGPGPYDQTTEGVQNVTALLWTAPIKALRNEFAIGWDVSRQTNDRIQYNYEGTRAAKDLYTPAHSPDPALAAALANVRENTGTDYSLFVDDRLWLSEQFSLSAGVRVQQFSNRQDQSNFGALTTCDGKTGTFTNCFFSREAENALVNPKVAAVWEPAESVSVYLSYSKSAMPPGNSVGNGDALAALGTGASITTASLDPEESDTLDLGVKWALFRQRVLIQAGLYQTDRENAQETDQATGVLVVSGEPSQQLRGFELGISGAIKPNLQLSANFSHIDAEIIEAFANGALDLASIGKQVRYVPEDSASLWATYEPAIGGVQGLQIGAGFNYQSKVYLNLQNTQATPAYTSFDTLVSYTVDNFRVALNGYNLTDKFYYSQVNGGRVVPAAGRNFIASLQYNF